jgi:hypothetical protein
LCGEAGQGRGQTPAQGPEEGTVVHLSIFSLLLEFSFPGPEPALL